MMNNTDLNFQAKCVNTGKFEELFYKILEQMLNELDKQNSQYSEPKVDRRDTEYYDFRITPL